MQAHFNKFSTWYISQHYYVDIHPPLAKLAFAAMLWLVGFKGAQEDAPRWWVSEKEGGFIGTKDWLLLYEPEYGLPYLPLRRLSAAMGVALDWGVAMIGCGLTAMVWTGAGLTACAGATGWA